MRVFLRRGRHTLGHAVTGIPSAPLGLPEAAREAELEAELEAEAELVRPVTPVVEAVPEYLALLREHVAPSPSTDAAPAWDAPVEAAPAWDAPLQLPPLAAVVPQEDAYDDGLDDDPYGLLVQQAYGLEQEDDERHHLEQDLADALVPEQRAPLAPLAPLALAALADLAPVAEVPEPLPAVAPLVLPQPLPPLAVPALAESPFALPVPPAVEEEPLDTTPLDLAALALPALELPPLDLAPLDQPGLDLPSFELPSMALPALPSLALPPLPPMPTLEPEWPDLPLRVVEPAALLAPAVLPPAALPAAAHDAPATAYRSPALDELAGLIGPPMSFDAAAEHDDALPSGPGYDLDTDLGWSAEDALTLASLTLDLPAER